MPIPTIADVARAAEVSKATVSRVLNGDYAYIREETRLRVQQAIADLGYRPNSAARSLTSKRTQTLAILVTDVGNPFYSDVIHGFEDAAIKKNYSVFLGNVNYDAGRGMALIQSLVDRRVDGVALMSSTTGDGWIEELTRGHIPSVLVDWDVEIGGPLVSRVAVDYLPGIRAAVEHLWQLGHRRFAHVSGPLHLPTSRERQAAFLACLAEHGVSPREIPCIQGNYRIDGGRAAAEEVLALAPRPSAVFAANDLLAYGFLSAVHAHGLRVPRDLSLVGLDDIWLAAEMSPPLTTVSLPTYEIGALAAQELFELLDRPPAESSARRRVVSSGLVIRQSTAAPPDSPVSSHP